MLAGRDAPAAAGSSAGGQGCLHGLGALLEVAHPADGFGLLDQLAVAAMNHLVVGLPAAAVLGELVAWGKTLLLLSELADLTEGSSFRSTAQILSRVAVGTADEHATKGGVSCTE